MLFLLQLIALCAALFSVRASPTFFQPVGSEAWRQFIPPLLLNAIILASIVLYAVAEIAFLLVLYRWTKDDEKSRKTDTLSHYLRNLGFGEQLSSHIATCWYHFKVEHRDPPIALDERRLRTRTGVLLKDEYVGAMNDRRQVKCPTCGKRVWSYSRSWLWLKWLRWSKGSMRNSGNWTERDVTLALGALSHLFSAQNVEKYLRCRESRLERGGSVEAGAGGPEGAGDDGAAGNGWFSRALRRQRQRRQPQSR